MAMVTCRTCVYLGDDGECDLTVGIPSDKYLMGERGVEGCELGREYVDLFTDGSALFRNIITAGVYRAEFDTVMGVDPTDPQGWVAVVEREGDNIVFHIDPYTRAVVEAARSRRVAVANIKGAIVFQQK